MKKHGAQMKRARTAAWFLYILKCGDASLYTGVTTDLPVRLARHCAGRGARYTRGRGPLALVYWEPCAGRSDALKREREVKKLDRKDKLALVGPAGPRSVLFAQEANTGKGHRKSLLTK
jgi:predicted GIY-YIG superfamily endonuclease